MTETILMQTLKKHGLERFDPAEEGEKFNPNLHEATFFSPVEGKEDGTVFHTQQKGFLLNGRVLRVSWASGSLIYPSALGRNHMLTDTA
jgi:molecular chaperone GrpE